jgi:hypothetical protein
MAEQNLSAGLTALAEHAERTGRLAVATDIRARGNRRRGWRYAGSAGLALVVAAAFSAGIALGQPRSANERPAAPPVPAVSTPPVAVPPGVPSSPVKAPPPEYPYSTDPALPATTSQRR